jgi:transposase-like protein
LETVVTAKRDKAAALKFLKRIMKKYGRPLSVVTDGLCSYPAVMKETSWGKINPARSGSALIHLRGFIVSSPA